MNWTVVLVGGILLIGLSWLHGKATLDGLKVWLKLMQSRERLKKLLQLQGLLAGSNRANTNIKNIIYIFNHCISLSFVSYLQIVIHTKTTIYGL